MRAFHTNWTGPFQASRSAAAYFVPPFELFTTALSALNWRAFGGQITMMTDETGYAYYQSLGLLPLWDAVLPALEIPGSINPSVFWAAGKHYALRQTEAPCVMLDTDFILWHDISEIVGQASAAVIHFEDIVPEIYPPLNHFSACKGFDLSSLDWSVKPANTALAYFSDASFQGFYTKQAIRFMNACPEADNALTYMVFAEQRLLAMCASEKKIEIQALSDLPSLFLSGQTFYTHIWGYKRHLAADSALCDAFCRKCAARIKRDFPDYVPVLKHVPSLSKYFEA